jgi:hypothetical protein
MLERRLCTQRQALNLNLLPNIETILFTAHWLGRNGTLNSRDPNCRNYTVEVYSFTVYFRTLYNVTQYCYKHSYEYA